MMFDWSLIPAGDLIPWIEGVTTAALAAGLILLHSPHDVIAGIGVAGGGGPGRRKTVFAISRHNLLRSEQGGPWQRLTTGLGVWKLSSIAVSPNYDEDGTVFVASFGGGVFRSTNGGLSWEAVNAGLEDQQILLLGMSPDFVTDRVLFALSRGGGIHRSADGGDSWTTVSAASPAYKNDPAVAVLLDPLKDAGEAWRDCYWTSGPGCIAFARDAVVVGSSDGEILASRDGGNHWLSLARLPGGERITCIEIAPNATLDQPFFVGTDTAGVWRVTDAGQGLAATATPKALACVTALGSYREGGALVLMATGWNDAVFVSRDDGASWTLRELGLTKHRQADETRYGAPHFETLAVVPGADAPEVYLGGFDGLFHAETLGKPWGSIETLPLGNVLSLSINPGTPETGPAIAVATYGAGVYFRENDAAAWRILNRGLTTLRLGTIGFSPEWKTDGVLFTVNEGNLLRSTDRGGPWTPISLRPADASARSSVRLFARLRMLERFFARHLSGPWMNRLKALAHASALKASGRVNQYVFPTVITFSRQYKTDQTVFLGTRRHGVFRSTDAGKTYTQLWDGGGEFVTAMDIGAGGGPARTLFACVADGLHRSDDDGQTWTKVADSLAFQGSRMAMSPDYNTDGTLFVGGREGLLRSRDRGATWEPLVVDATVATPTIGGLSVSPAFAVDRTVLAQIRGSGLYQSTDGGETFSRLPWRTPDSDHAFTPLHCFPDANTLFEFSPDYANDGTIVAAAMDQVYITRDRGQTWTALDKPTRYESARPEITYTGGWTIADNDQFSAQRAHHSRRARDTASLRFAGGSVRWIGSRGPDHGMAEVLLNGELKTVVDLYAPRPEFGVELFSTALPSGHHEFTVRVKGTKNARSSGAEVWVDAIDAD